MRLSVLLLGALALVRTQAQQQQPYPCFRWSGQMAVGQSPAGVEESTLWYYGGQAMTSPTQSSNWWTNALISLDLTTNWSAGAPPMTLHPSSANPPAVSLGALWANPSGSELYLYGGQFSDNPDVDPPAHEIWRYRVTSNQWDVVPTTGDTGVTRAAEGSSAVAGSMGYFFSGHEDDHTTQGWSNQIARIYLSSMLTFDLGSHVIRNLTSYAANAKTSNDSTPQTSSTIVYRADGSLTYVPRLGTNGQGILVAVGGATSDSYIDNTALDVYDIGAQGWTKQPTRGARIGSRVNHCAVRASAKVNGVETHQIFVYGGQRLNQTDRDSAMYVLTIPSYTWTLVGDSLPGQPSGRAGHLCTLSGSQMVVIGGVLAEDVLCDSQSAYIYDVSKSEWHTSYQAGTTYSTPAIIANLTGGVGTGHSSSGAGSNTGGDGSLDADTSGDSDPTNPGGGNSGGGKKTPIGAIVGGVLGGLALLALLFFILVLLARRRRKAKARQGNGKEAGVGPFGMGAVADGDDDDRSSSAEGFAGVPYEKTSTSSGQRTDSPRLSDLSHQHQHSFYSNGVNGNNSNGGYYAQAASDDVEEESRNMVALGSSHLVPRQTLRVANPEQ